MIRLTSNSGITKVERTIHQFFLLQLGELTRRVAG